MQTSVTVTIDLKRLKQYKIDFGQAGLVVVYKKWAIRYRAYIQTRFVTNSRGGGDWPPLSPRTVAGRRKKSSVILRDTGTLFAALSPVWDSPPGGINKLIEGGVVVGFGGSLKHPSGFATIAEIAGFHQVGGGRLPKREIIVQPDSQTIRTFIEDLERELKK